MKELLLSYLEVLKQDILLCTMTMDVCLTAASGRFVSVVNFRFTSGPQTKVR